MFIFCYFLQISILVVGEWILNTIFLLKGINKYCLNWFHMQKYMEGKYDHWLQSKSPASLCDTSHPVPSGIQPSPRTWHPPLHRHTWRPAAPNCSERLKPPPGFCFVVSSLRCCPFLAQVSSPALPFGVHCNAVARKPFQLSVVATKVVVLIDWVDDCRQVDLALPSSVVGVAHTLFLTHRWSSHPRNTAGGRDRLRHAHYRSP